LNGVAKILFAMTSVLYGAGRCARRVGIRVCVHIAPATALPKAEPILKVARYRPVMTATSLCFVAACIDVCVGNGMNPPAKMC
jgi:hypothetical protein